MSEAQAAPSSPAPANALVVEDELHAAEQARSTAKWVGGALSVVPALGLLSAFIRAPGEAGWDPALLAVGLAFLAIGIGTCFALVAWVISPAVVSDDEIAELDDVRVINAVPRPGRTSYSGRDLLEDIRSSSNSVYWEEKGVVDAAIAMRHFEELKAGRDSILAEVQKRADREGATAAEKEAAKVARAEAESAALTLASAKAAHGRKSVAAEPYVTRHLRLNEIRSQAILLESGRRTQQRLRDSVPLFVLGVMASVIGVGFLAVAPIPKSAATSSPTEPLDGSLVRFTVRADGVAATGCPSGTIVDAVLVKEEAGTVTLITLPSVACPRAATVTFPISGRSGVFGDIDAVAPVTPSASP